MVPYMRNVPCLKSSALIIWYLSVVLLHCDKEEVYENNDKHSYWNICGYIVIMQCNYAFWSFRLVSWWCERVQCVSSTQDVFNITKNIAWELDTLLSGLLFMLCFTNIHFHAHLAPHTAPWFFTLHNILFIFSLFYFKMSLTSTFFCIRILASCVVTNPIHYRRLIFYLTPMM